MPVEEYKTEDNQILYKSSMAIGPVSWQVQMQTVKNVYLHYTENKIYKRGRCAHFFCYQVPYSTSSLCNHSYILLFD